MQNPPAVLAALTMMAVALSGCTGGGGDMDMLVTPSDDPVSSPYTFEATGAKKDHYTWDFGDGVQMEGRVVEHTFGFTDGAVVVALTGHNEGEDPTTIRRSVPLGGAKNVGPQGVMTANTQWALTSETIVLSAAGSSDANGDPLLYRWICEKVIDLRPPDDGGGHSHPAAGVPFGVNEWSKLDDALSGATVDHGGDLCAANAPENTAYSRDADSIQGTIGETGVYRINLYVKDPKSSPWIGELHLFISESRPASTQSIPFSGTITGGNGEELENNCEQIDEQFCELFGDHAETFSLSVPNDGGSKIVFDNGGNGFASTQYTIYTSDGSVKIPTQTETGELLLSKNQFFNGRTYVVVFEVAPVGPEVSYEWTFENVGDMEPKHHYQGILGL